MRRGGGACKISRHALVAPGSVLSAYRPFYLGLIPLPLAPESVSHTSIFVCVMTATMLRSRLPSLVAGGRRYPVQRPIPKLARFLTAPSADVSPPSLNVGFVCWIVEFTALRMCAVEEDGPLRFSR